jgi:CO dehydrogenase nickel-insertion accessory protein CooC1
MTSYKDIDLLNLKLDTVIKSPNIKCLIEKNKMIIVNNGNDSNFNRILDIINHIKRLSQSKEIFNKENNPILDINKETKFFNKKYQEININKLNNQIDCKLLFKYLNNKLILIQCLVL